LYSTAGQTQSSSYYGQLCTMSTLYSKIYVQKNRIGGKIFRGKNAEFEKKGF
jgi:hypothetical protein